MATLDVGVAKYFMQFLLRLHTSSLLKPVQQENVHFVQTLLSHFRGYKNANIQSNNSFTFETTFKHQYFECLRTCKDRLKFTSDFEGTLQKIGALNRSGSTGMSCLKRHKKIPF